MTSRRLTCAIILAVLSCSALSATAVAAQRRAEAPAEVKLVRCEPGSPAVCVELGVRVAPEFIVTDTSDAATPKARWTLNLGSPRFVGPATAQGSTAEPPVSLLVLLDVSGSMIGAGMAFTRPALRTFLNSLPATGVQVAVAPFGSRDVERTIRSARFGTPAAAMAHLDAIPAPARNANTALYSAVHAGAATVARSTQAQPETRRALLLVTDGKNEVGRPGDDRGLLPNDSLRAAAAPLKALGVELFALGVGPGVLQWQLDSLAADSGKSYIIALDPVRLNEQLALIRQEIADRQTLTFGSGADVSAFGRILRRADLRVADAAGRKGETVAISWTPPLLALPAFAGSANASNLDGSLRDFVASLDSLPLERWIYVVVMLVMGIVLWGLIPRWIWSPVLMERAVVREKSDQSLEPAGARAEGYGSGLRDAKEAAPRGQTDVTGEFPIAR